MAAPSTRKRGSKQFWPRVRSKKSIAVVNSWDPKGLYNKESQFLGFPAYKVSMTSIGVIDNFSHTITKGTEINVPVTILEAPPVKVLSVRLFALDEYENIQVVKEVTSDIKDKNLSRKIAVIKKAPEKISTEDLIKFATEHDVEDVRVKVVTTPSATTIGKKKPEILEIGVSGSIDARIKFAMSKLGQEVKVNDVFKSGDLTDSHGITIGKGNQGAVKRFGVKLTSHKSEKTRRHAGNVGAWTPSRVLTTIPMPGQHGFHERTEWNKWILKISSNPEEINTSAGFRAYGKVSGDFLLVKGSVQGSKTRLITLVKSARPNERYPKVAPEITYINK